MAIWRVYHITAILFHLFIVYTVGQICSNGIKDSDVSVTKTAPNGDTIKFTNGQTNFSMSCDWTAAIGGCDHFLIFQFTGVNDSARETVCGQQGRNAATGTADAYHGKDRVSCTFSYRDNNTAGDMTMTLRNPDQSDVGRYFCAYQISNFIVYQRIHVKVQTAPATTTTPASATTPTTTPTTTASVVLIILTMYA